jgi:hypothetical protein
VDKRRSSAPVSTNQEYLEFKPKQLPLPKPEDFPILPAQQQASEWFSQLFWHLKEYVNTCSSSGGIYQNKINILTIKTNLPIFFY